LIRFEVPAACVSLHERSVQTGEYLDERNVAKRTAMFSAGLVRGSSRLPVILVNQRIDSSAIKIGQGV